MPAKGTKQSEESKAHALAVRIAKYGAFNPPIEHHKRPDKICPQCSHPFNAWGTTFCSPACSGASRKKARLCEHCGKTYTHLAAKSGTGMGKQYCSRACYAAARRKPASYTCQHCGIMVAEQPNKKKQRQFCDRCKHVANPAAQPGSLSPNWRGGVALLPYGPEFTRRFKALIRLRDGNRCLHCGKTREQNWRALDVHHIDHDKMNNDPTNLVTVCHQCNQYFSHHRDESLLAFPRRRMLI